MKNGLMRDAEAKDVPIRISSPHGSTHLKLGISQIFGCQRSLELFVPSPRHTSSVGTRWQAAP